MVIPFSISDNTPELNFSIAVGGGGGDRLPNYAGSYSVVPKTTSITLPTKNKSMLNDVEILQIPYAETTNPDGSTTVVIGLEQR